MRTSESISLLVTRALEAAQQSGTLPAAGDVEVVIEKPKQAEHGDFSSSVALSLARTMRMAPLKIAEQIAAHVPSSPLVSKVTAAAPGFVNFTLSREWLISQIGEILSAGEKYGQVKDGVGQRVQVEFVSVNPTGPLHVGHARGAVLGSGIASVLEAAGYEIQREYYVNDAGAQMRVFYDTLYARFMQAAGKDVPLPEPSYPGEYLADMARELLKENPALADSDEAAVKAAISPIALERTLAAIRSVLESLGITYDNWFFESSLASSGTLAKTLKMLEDNGYIVERDDARWFRSTAFGEDEDDVVIRSGEHVPTYFGTDLAYHYDKFLVRKFNRVINVWGADHHGHVSRLKAAVKALGGDPDDLTIILNQIVSFKNEGEVVRFSKRKGNIVTVEELVAEVGADACRFIFLSRTPNAQMEFDLALATKQSSENPVYYVQYAHARLAAILRNAEEQGLSSDGADMSLLTHDAELELLRRLVELPDMVHRAAKNLEPHHLPYYATELARTLQRFYEQCRVISENKEDQPVSRARLKLVEAARVVFARTLELMGMSAPDRM
jgi:arginyl-tRNA synthetase